MTGLHPLVRPVICVYGSIAFRITNVIVKTVAKNATINSAVSETSSKISRIVSVQFADDCEDKKQPITDCRCLMERSERNRCDESEVNFPAMLAE